MGPSNALERLTEEEFSRPVSKGLRQVGGDVDVPTNMEPDKYCVHACIT
jgi:hypothetical protein